MHRNFGSIITIGIPAYNGLTVIGREIQNFREIQKFKNSAKHFTQNILVQNNPFAQIQK